MTTEIASRCYADLYSALFWAQVDTPERYGRKPQAGQRSLFGDEPDAPTAPGKHDVSQEARDESGEWTAGGTQSNEPPVDQPSDVATLEQDETEPASGDTEMATPSDMWALRKKDPPELRQVRKPGATVQLSSKVLHEPFRLRTGKVTKWNKSHDTVRVTFDDGQTYDAYAKNLQLIEPSSEPDPEPKPRKPRQPKSVTPPPAPEPVYPPIPDELTELAKTVVAYGYNWPRIATRNSWVWTSDIDPKSTSMTKFLRKRGFETPQQFWEAAKRQYEPARQ
jgi:hypothetical protein